MNKQQIVFKYLDIVFSNGILDELFSIFTKDLDFHGPFLQSNTAKEYIDSLKANPPIDFQYQLIDYLEQENKVAIFYHFSKGKIQTPMAQLFSFEGEKIKSIRLIFDSSVFNLNNS